MDGIQIAGVMRQSIVDGSGLRMTIFTQGCPHHCPGCHNPETHDFEGGYLCKAETILSELKKNPLLSGITLSGGEPLCRAGELLPLAQAVREQNRNIWCYTGYTFEELLQKQPAEPNLAALLQEIDVLVDGPFLLDQRDLSLQFRGSRNQRILDLPASLARQDAILWEDSAFQKSELQRI